MNFHVLTKPEEVAQHYQMEEVALQYIQQRFHDPLNKVEHQQQVFLLNSIIKDKQCERVVEFAPGPARITAELAIEGGTSIEGSKEMIHIARQRMRERKKKWTFLQKDILQDRLEEPVPYDLLFTFRFLLHFQEQEREKIYQQAKKMLKPGGYLVFEALNAHIVQPLRKFLGEGRYFIYDHLYTRQELISEMESNGFKVLRLYPVLSHFWIQSFLSRPLKLFKLKKSAERAICFWEQFPSQQPYEWIVLAQKRKELSSELISSGEE